MQFLNLLVGGGGIESIQLKKQQQTGAPVLLKSLHCSRNRHAVRTRAKGYSLRGAGTLDCVIRGSSRTLQPLTGEANTIEDNSIGQEVGRIRQQIEQSALEVGVGSRKNGRAWRSERCDDSIRASPVQQAWKRLSVRTKSGPTEDNRLQGHGHTMRYMLGMKATPSGPSPQKSKKVIYDRKRSEARRSLCSHTPVRVPSTYNRHGHQNWTDKQWKKVAWSVTGGGTSVDSMGGGGSVRLSKKFC